MKILRQNFIFCVILTLAIFISRGSRAADCAACAKLVADFQASAQALETSRGLLAGNKAMLASLSPSDVSKKVKLTSNILILTAKLETAENQRTLYEQQYVTMGCSACPK
ncbi:MAG: hypothetical protein HY074_08630 [Deltaproteobacteria bacterium]|nr:hypothetical protein [Deltaproteobacteria bacterium]